MLFNSGIGIEISENQVNMVYLKASLKGGVTAGEAGFLLDTDKPVRERLNDAAGFINGFIREHGVSATDIYLGIPGELAMLRVIEFPLAVKENLRGTLEYELEKYIPIPTEDVCFDCRIISEDRSAGKLSVLAVVARKEDIEPYFRLADLVDGGFSGIEIIPAAISNYYLSRMGDHGDSAVIVNLKENGFDLIHVKHGSLVYSRSICRTGGGDEGHFQVIEHLAKARGLFGNPEQRMRLLILGGAAADEIAGQLPEELRFDVIKPDMYDTGVSGERYLPAFGLALKGMQKPPVQMNLMPPGLRKRPDKTSYLVMVVLCALLVLSGVVWAGSHVMNQRRILERLDSELNRLRTEAAAVEQIQADSKKIRDRIDYLSSLRPGNVYVSDVLKELSSIIPVTAWIRSLKLAGNELTLYGSAESASGLIPILEDSPLFTDVRFLSAIRKGRDGKEVFRIGLHINNRQ